MRSASSEFRKMLSDGDTKYSVYADISLKDGTNVSITNKNLWMGGFSMEDSVSSDDSFDVGAAIINKFTLVINNIYDEFSDYDFMESTATVFVSLIKDDGTETDRIRMCTGTVTEPPKEYSSIISLNFYDNMMKFDRPYSESKLSYPTSLGEIVRDACSVCGVTLNTVTFPHDDFVIQEKPTDEAITFREIISWVAQIVGCFCKCDEYGRLELQWYNSELLENPTESDDIHIISKNYQSPIVSIDDVVITGARVVEKNETDETDENLTTYQSGNDGYVISVEGNELIKNGAGQTVAGWLGEKLIGFRFRKASMNHASDPTIEAGDVAILRDRNGKEYKVIISSTRFSNNGSQSSESSAESPVMNSSARYSAETKIYVEWRKNLKKEKTEREKAIESLGDRIEKSSGVFTTVETDSAGGKIYYLHNKPTLKDSDMIWKMTVEAWAVSTDGGETWNAGMTVDGDTIVRILTAVGLNADWINAGAITVKDSNGNIIFSVDMDTKSVVISGDSVRIGGKTATQALKDNLQESKDYSDGKLADYADTVSKSISDLQAQVDGQVEDWYYDYEPSMQNYPANEWTTTEEREKHIGDRFFWKSKGYAYRFMENNGVWGWVLLQDTDITKAMQAAQNAQDTADGKRRTFVETPVPPYDIGDLWTNGTDVLTCTTPSPSGSVFVSSDWQKLNQYTDDTVALEALEEAKKNHNITMQLDNDYQGISTDYKGEIPYFPNITTTASVFYGYQDVSLDCSYDIQESEYVDGNWNEVTRTYTVTGLSADSGFVDITASYMNLFTVTKRFNVAKIKGGVPGTEGESARTYFLITDPTILKRSQDNSINPNTVNFSSFYRDGNSAESNVYNGRFKIEESSDGKTWTTIYTSSVDESSVTFHLYSLLATDTGKVIIDAKNQTIGVPRDTICIRCTLFASGGISTELDVQSVTVVTDIDALTHEQIFDLFTNNGKYQGIYTQNNNIYINASYLKSGIIEGIDFISKRGNDWFKISESLATGGYNDETDGLLDLSAQYENERNVVLEARTYDLIIKAKAERNIIFESGNVEFWDEASFESNVLFKNEVSFESYATFKSYTIFSGYSMFDGSAIFNKGVTFNSTVTLGKPSTFYEQITFMKASKMYYLQQVSSGGHIVFASDGATLAYLASSSHRYKNHVRELNIEEAMRALDIPVVWFKYKEGYLSPEDRFNDKPIPGFYAEDVLDYFSEAAQLNLDGQVEDWNYRVMIPIMMKLIQHLYERGENHVNHLQKRNLKTDDG